MLNAVAKSSCFSVGDIKDKYTHTNKKTLNSVQVVEDGAKREGVVL